MSELPLRVSQTSAHNIKAPEVNRTDVKLAASIAVSRSAARHSHEFAASGIIAIAVRSMVRGWVIVASKHEDAPARAQAPAIWSGGHSGRRKANAYRRDDETGRVISKGLALHSITTPA